MTHDFLDASNAQTIATSYKNLAAGNAAFPGNVCVGVPNVVSGGSATTSPPNPQAVQDAANGSLDAAIEQAATLIAAKSSNPLLRFMWEMNGNWMTWCIFPPNQTYPLLPIVSPALFIDLFERHAEIVHSIIPGAQIMWNPTRGNPLQPTAPQVPDLSAYFPPDPGVVQVIGTDVYDQEWGSYPGQPAEWNHMLTQTYGINWIVNLAKSKGLAVAFPEWAPCVAASGPNTSNAPGDDVTLVQGMTALAKSLVAGGTNVFLIPWNIPPWAANFPKCYATLQAAGLGSVGS